MRVRIFFFIVVVDRLFLTAISSLICGHCCSVLLSVPLHFWEFKKMVLAFLLRSSKVIYWSRRVTELPIVIGSGWMSNSLDSFSFSYFCLFSVKTGLQRNEGCSVKQKNSGCLDTTHTGN